jgi:hypothetical protein
MIKLDSIVTYQGSQHKVVGILIDKNGDTIKVMLNINGKMNIIDLNQISE